jgi:hypothetical protein
MQMKLTLNENCHTENRKFLIRDFVTQFIDEFEFLTIQCLSRSDYVRLLCNRVTLKSDTNMNNNGKCIEIEPNLICVLQYVQKYKR